MKKIKSIEEIPIDSSKLCCNFVNTVYAWKGDNQDDFLTDYSTFIQWCIRLAIDDQEELSKLRRRAKKRPADAITAMNRIRKSREGIQRLIKAVAHNDEVGIAQSLAVVNPLIAEALSQVNLTYAAGRFVIDYKISLNLMRPVWIILKSLYDMLTADEKSRIKECPSCGWVFFDETKNGKRRWCNPLNCGTKDKMDRYTKKLRAQNKQ